MSISKEKFKEMLKEKGLKVTNQRLLVLARKRKNAEIAQLVEHNLAKVRVASSSLVFRSCFFEMLEI